MNWLDIVLLVILVVGAYYGLKTGLIGASFTVIGVVVGVLLAGQLSDDVGELFEDSISNDTVVTFISYAIIIAVAVVVSQVAARILRGVIKMLFLGWVDRLGGIALGVLAGVAVSGALIIGTARLTYNFEIPTEGVPAQVVEKFVPVADAKEWLEDALVGSALVPVFIDLTDALPADALGFVPSDFQIALDILEERIDAEDGDGSTDQTTETDEEQDGDGSSDGDQQELDVTLTQTTIHSATESLVSVSATVDVRNPNSFAVTLNQIDYRLTFVDAGTPYPLGAGTLTDIALDPSKTTELNLPLTLDPSEVTGAMGLVERVANGESMLMLVSATLTVDISGEETEITLSSGAQAELPN